MQNTNLSLSQKLLSDIKDHEVYRDGFAIWEANPPALIWQAQDAAMFDFDIQSEEGHEILLYFDQSEEEDGLGVLLDREDADYVVAAYLEYVSLSSDIEITGIDGKKFERVGMVRRVVRERQKKANKLEYRVKLGDNLYDEHLLQSPDGREYRVTIWDFDLKIGYVNNIDWKTNKLATTKHIIYLVDYIKEKKSRWNKLRKQKSKIELTLDPLEDYSLTWKYNQPINTDDQHKIDAIFDGKSHLSIPETVAQIDKIKALDTDVNFIIREEIFDRVSRFFDQQSLEERSVPISEIDFSGIKADMYGYQKEGAYFALFRSASIIADEMGLGKTMQAISTSLLKKEYLDFERVLVICPSSVKYQWQQEIEKFSDEKATVINGSPSERIPLYANDNYFTVVNYEMALRDKWTIDNVGYDLIILDEAQRIKNFNTKTASIIQGLNKVHGLVLTGTPIENKLIDIYSIMLFLDKYRLTPLWEFSYQHCIFDRVSIDKINGYYNLTQLKKSLSDIVIRRQKREVLTQLPSIKQKNYILPLHPEQQSMHNSFHSALAKVLSKKFLTKFDWDRIMMILTKMRMVCNSTYLVGDNENHSSKLKELAYILKHQLNVQEEGKKIIIFSEWLDSLKLIEEVLDKQGLKYVKLTGSVPPIKRGALVSTFVNDPECSVFLSTEAGGSGLNLQIADTVINFEIPWNPAKKNQRIGRIDRIGQVNDHLLVINLICQGSIEMRINTGLSLKQNLFEGVLNDNKDIDTVDFTEKGRSQFIDNLKKMVDDEQEPIKPNYEFNGADFNDIKDEDEETGNIENNQIEEDIELVFEDPDENMDWNSILDEEFDVIDEKQKEKHSSVEQNSVTSSPKDQVLNPSTISDDQVGQHGSNEQNDQTNQKNKPVTLSGPNTEKMEEVLSKGVDFLAGIYEMTTGKKMVDEEKGKSISIDKETGEVVFRFKIG